MLHPPSIDDDACCDNDDDDVDDACMHIDSVSLKGILVLAARSTCNNGAFT